MRKSQFPFAVLTAIAALGCSSRGLAGDPGVTDTEIVIGAHTNESGALADKMPLLLSMYFDDVNAAGGIHGRKIKFIRYDGAYVVSRAVENTKKLVEQDKIFAMVAAVPSISHQAVWKYLVQKGVPDVFFGDALKIYGEPFQRLLFPMVPEIGVDGATAAKYLAPQMGGKKVCFIAVNSETGIQYAEGAKKAFEEFNKTADAKAKVAIGPMEKVERDSVNSNPQMLNLKREKCDAIFASVFQAAWAQQVNFAWDQNFKPQWVTWLYNGKGFIFNLIKEPARDGIITTQQTLRDPRGPDDKVWKEVEAFAEKHNVKDAISSVPVAFWVGEAFTEALKRAGRDLTREKLITALESMGGWQCKVCLMPMDLSPTNHWPFLKPKVVNWRNGKLTMIEKQP